MAGAPDSRPHKGNRDRCREEREGYPGEEHGNGCGAIFAGDAAGDFTTKDTKNTKATDGSRSPGRLNCAARSAKDELENPGAMVAAK